ncbi:hypothetical protein [Pararhodonellum marinum]|uniref:hypothetical protein n=1 Tax=Pararhodonellum marinum TaxID=2755358 RepID=UPI00188EF2A8|nr:hypothetical protein [Pararhodonellum marinum]
MKHLPFTMVSLSFLMLFLVACQPKTEQHTFAEKEGIIRIEAESHPPVSGWELKTDNPGYSGKGYLEWTGEMNFDPDFGVLHFALLVENEGDYHFRIYNRHDHPHDYTENNDIFTKTNDGDWLKTFSHLSYKEWGWDTRFEMGHLDFMDPPKVYLKKGRNDFYIGGRSPGFKMDQIHFFHSQMIADHYDTNQDNPHVLAINLKDSQHED